ncbi:MAG: acetoin utilization protein AcuC, partial [Thermodesulfobacteriota bacterium]
MTKTAFLYSEKFSTVSYGSDHPMRPLRLKLAFELIKEKKLFALENSGIIAPRQATLEELLTAHTADYIEALKESDSGRPPENGNIFGLGLGDNPCFKGVFEWSKYVAGASIQAAELVSLGKKDIVFNISGGLHHALRAKASGFCYINDPVVAINFLLKQGKRVAYVDIDAHHGDGVQAAFYDTDNVLTISLHESGDLLFPGTGFPEDFGTGAGRGYSVNLPFPIDTGDELFTWGFEEVAPPFIETYKPDILVTQLGVDTFVSDPITHLRLT